MKLFRVFSFFMILILALAGFSAVQTPAAQAQSTPPPATVVDLLAANGQFTTLVKLLKSTGVVDMLTGPGPFTLFAPTDSAFARLPRATLAALQNDPEKLKIVLEYHIVVKHLMLVDIALLSSANTSNGQPVVFSNRYGLAYVDNARILGGDYQAGNGVVHMVDSILLPPDKDIVDTIAANPQLSTLVSLINAAGAADILKGKGPYTLFAPTNAAFAQLPAATLDALKKDPEKLKSLLLYHTVDSATYSGDIAKTSSGGTLNGADVIFAYRLRQSYVNGAHIIITDVLATNGVIHLIDTVLAPPDKTITDLVAANPQLTVLAGLLKTSGLTSTLSGQDDYTLLAPTDAAFAKIPQATLNALAKDPTRLQALLLYHVIKDSSFSADLIRMSNAQTAGGPYVAVTHRIRQIYINNARVVAADLQASNGVVHMVDTVLLPPDKDIADTVAANPQLKTLAGLVKTAGLVSTLKGPGPFTLFAPSDNAFARLALSPQGALLKDPQKLNSLLLYHVIPNRLFSGDFSKTPSATTISGADLVYSERYGRGYVNNIPLATTDIVATNGVIQMVDTVLPPPDKDIVQIIAANPQLQTLSAAIQKAGLVDTLKGKGPYTVFAPTDAAFVRAPKGTLNEVMKDPTLLSALLLDTTIPGALYSGDAVHLEGANAVGGAALNFTVVNGFLYIDNARVLTSDILASNGVIHIVDAVIFPGK